PLHAAAVNEGRIQTAEDLLQRQRHKYFVPVGFGSEDVRGSETQLTESNSHSAARELSEDLIKGHGDHPRADVGVAEFWLQFERQSGQDSLQGKLHTFSILLGAVASSWLWREARGDRSNIGRRGGCLSQSICCGRCFVVVSVSGSFSRQLA